MFLLESFDRDRRRSFSTRRRATSASRDCACAPRTDEWLISRDRLADEAVEDPGVTVESVLYELTDGRVLVARCARAALSENMMAGADFSSSNSALDMELKLELRCRRWRSPEGCRGATGACTDVGAEDKFENDTGRGGFAAAAG
jgi:hypothetical protein